MSEKKDLEKKLLELNKVVYELALLWDNQLNFMSTLSDKNKEPLYRCLSNIIDRLDETTKEINNLKKQLLLNQKKYEPQIRNESKKSTTLQDLCIENEEETTKIQENSEKSLYSDKKSR